MGGQGPGEVAPRWTGGADMRLFPQRSRRRSVLRAGRGPSLSNYPSVGKALSTMGPSGHFGPTSADWDTRGSRASLSPRCRHASSRRWGWRVAWDWLARGLSADDSLRLERYDTQRTTGHRLLGIGSVGFRGPGQDAPGSIRVAPVAADHSNRFGDQTPVSSDVGDTELHMKLRVRAGSARYNSPGNTGSLS